MMPGPSRPTIAVALLLSPFAGHATAAGQNDPPLESSWETDFRLAGANALLGGLTGSVLAFARGEDITNAFTGGMLGGATMYVGKRVAAEREFGAGLAGRQLSLLGASMVNNAANSRGVFDQLAFGFGPVRWYWRTRSSGLAWAIDVPAVAGMVWGLANPARTLEIESSLSSGALVFSADDQVSGDFSVPGTIFYHKSKSRDRELYVLAHERVHILQYDQTFFMWGEPFEEWVGARVRVLRAPLRILEFNVVGLAAGGLGSWFWQPHSARPWEREAMYLAR